MPKGRKYLQDEKLSLNNIAVFLNPAIGIGRALGSVMSYKYPSLAAIFFFLMVGLCRADTILDVNASNIQFGLSDTVNISMQLDETTLTVVPGTAMFAFTGALAGTTFTLAPLCSGLETSLCSVYSSPTYALFNWTDAEGDIVQLGDFDYSCAYNGFVCSFPAVGSYPGFFVEAYCNNYIEQSPCDADLGSDPFPAHGIVTVTPTPEPSTCSFMLAGLGLLGLVMRKRIAEGLPATH